MPSIKDLKKSIGSVKNTQQTTRAMKMVSAAKFRRAQDLVGAYKPYASGLVEMLHGVIGHQPHRAIEKEGAEIRRVLIVVVTSDRGLCGAFNSSVLRAAQKFSEIPGCEYTFAGIGRKACEYLKFRQLPRWAAFEESAADILKGRVSFSRAKSLASMLMDWYYADQCDAIEIVSNSFVNAATQITRTERFLPIRQAGAFHEGTLVRPSQDHMIDALFAAYGEVMLSRILLESQAGEHGARMAAMENATKNAGELIGKLTLQYNKQRQAGITKELLEIIAGSESQKSA